MERNSSSIAFLKNNTIQAGEFKQSLVNKIILEGRELNLIFKTILLRGDNQGSITLAHNPVFHSKIKHIDI